MRKMRGGASDAGSGRLATLNLDKALPKAAYKRQLKTLQLRLTRIQQAYLRPAICRSAPEIAALLAFIRLEEFDYNGAAAIALLLLAFALVLLLASNLLQFWASRHREANR
jgi:hypothetical protein